MRENPVCTKMAAHITVSGAWYAYSKCMVFRTSGLTAFHIFMCCAFSFYQLCAMCFVSVFLLESPVNYSDHAQPSPCPQGCEMTAPTATDKIKEEMSAKDARFMVHIHGCANLGHGTRVGHGGGELMFCMP